MAAERMLELAKAAHEKTRHPVKPGGGFEIAGLQSIEADFKTRFFDAYSIQFVNIRATRSGMASTGTRIQSIDLKENHAL